MIVEAWWAQSMIGEASRLETQERVVVWIHNILWRIKKAGVSHGVWSQSAGECPLAWGSQPFVLFRPSVARIRPTHIMEGNLLYSKSTNLMYILYKNTITETPKIMSVQIFGHSGPDRLIYKINHYIIQNQKTWEFCQIEFSMSFCNKLLNLFLFPSVQKIPYLSLVIVFLYSHLSKQMGSLGSAGVCVCAHAHIVQMWFNLKGLVWY